MAEIHGLFPRQPLHGGLVSTTPGTGSADGGVALVALSTESPYHSRGNVYMVDLARSLRQQRIPSRVFQVQLAAAGEEENHQRVDRLVERLIAEGCKWAVFQEIWTPELGSRLQAAQIGLIEVSGHSFEGAISAREEDLLNYVGECVQGHELDELADLVEIVGPRQPRPITSIDLRTGHSCGYKQALSQNPFYSDVLDVPEVASHRGCAYCPAALHTSELTAAKLATRLVERIRRDRQVFPELETFWMAYAETYYDALAIAFRTMRGDPAWQGVTLAMQCRPDVIAGRAGEIEALAAAAAACGTKLRIGVVGFENCSPPEILVLNRGAAPEKLEAAAIILNRWAKDTPAGLVVRGFTPSFILFTPWTRMQDLDENLDFIGRHGFWSANIERLRIGPGTPAFAKARHDGLVSEAAVRTAPHPNGYTSERETRFADATVAAVSAGFERLRPFASSEQPELLAGVLATVRAASNPALLDWGDLLSSWESIGVAAGHA